MDHFGLLLMLTVTARAFLLVTWVATNALFFFLRGSNPLKGAQKHVLAFSGYLELGMFDDTSLRARTDCVRG